MVNAETGEGCPVRAAMDAIDRDSVMYYVLAFF